MNTCVRHGEHLSTQCPRCQAGKVASEQPKDETGWVLIQQPANGRPHRYIGVIDGLLQWTEDNLKALRLARRADAEALCEIVDDCWHVEEHMWCYPAAGTPEKE